MTWKLIGIAAILLAGGLVGIHFAGRLSSRTAALEAILRMLEELRVQIRYRALPMGELLDSLCENPALHRLTFLPRARDLFQRERDFEPAWKQAVSELRGESGLLAQDEPLLLAVGASLGKSDIEGQLAAIELHAQLLSDRLAEASDEQAKKGKLYRSLGMLSGVALAILLF